MRPAPNMKMRSIKQRDPFVQHGLDVVPFGRDAGDMRRHRQTFIADLKNGVTCAFLGRTASAKRHRKKLWGELREALPHAAQFFRTGRCLRWKKFEA